MILRVFVISRHSFSRKCCIDREKRDFEKSKFRYWAIPNQYLQRMIGKWSWQISYFFRKRMKRQRLITFIYWSTFFEICWIWRASNRLHLSAVHLFLFSSNNIFQYDSHFVIETLIFLNFTLRCQYSLSRFVFISVLLTPWSLENFIMTTFVFVLASSSQDPHAKSLNVNSSLINLRHIYTTRNELIQSFIDNRERE